MYVKVTVRPGAKREEVKRGEKGFVIAVKEPAERNLANERVRMLVAHALNLPVRSLRLVAGFRSTSKIFSVPD